MSRRKAWLAALVCMLPAAPGLAQTVLNPKLVEFVPSPDHAGLTPDSQPMITRYELGFFLVGAAAPFQVIDLGKPTPSPAGTITVDFSTRLSAWPLPNGDYLARVTAVGPTGTAPSEPSNAFTFLSCAYSVSPIATTVPAAGGSATVALSAPAGCTWTAASGDSWITVATASGTGSSSVTMTAAANTTTASRTGTVSIGGRGVTVAQDGDACSFTVRPASLSYGSAGGTETVTLRSSAACAWTTLSGASWLTVTPAAGAGRTTVSVTAGANTTSALRTASVTLGGQTVPVVQSATARPLAPGKLRVIIK